MPGGSTALPAGTEWIEILLADINGIFRGKRLPAEDLPKLLDGAVMLPRGTVLLDTLGNASENVPYGYPDGDPDRALRPLLHTLKPIPWQRRAAAQVLVTVGDDDGEEWFANPRTVLARCLAEFEPLGLRPVMALELEFHLFSGTGLSEPGSGSDAAGVAMPLPAGTLPGRFAFPGRQTYHLEYLDDFEPLFADIEAAAALQGIPLGSALSEFGRGQFEINLQHTSDVLQACDQALLLKRLVRQCALKHGCLASFMAKPMADDSGNGLHVHMSLLDDTGCNVFADPVVASKQGNESGSTMSSHLQRALGGVLDSLPDTVALLAPNANSFQRLVPDSFAPVVADWGRDHRAVAVRIPRADAGSCRFEHRVAGADANPYLVAAAVLAGVLQGLEQGPSLPEATQGLAVSPDARRLPGRWCEALSRFADARSQHRRLGNAFCELYQVAKQDEEAAWHREVATLDVARYLRLM